ncbi:aldose 1-epimerase [Asticcacaulis sp. SL142]|uniref:aldose 1-epimerase n=1 Tax=Asticcacaulis sp. SL142 TaxID=2995155 RepID=UPI00226CBD9B|nr:aldose 1-epimerase [Asticcacaulis sp. SL142]WAC49867.1 aldose 1-epimerase [Asticcacaulis sp. SL142]
MSDITEGDTLTLSRARDAVCTLTVADTQLRIAPHLGASTLSLTHKGRDYLRRAPDGAGDVLQTGNFLLVPFANRIKNGHFVIGTKDIQLKPNLGDHPHTLHGQGWRAAWQVAEISDSRARLVFDHKVGEWPWDYRAEVIYELRDGGLRIYLSVTNLSTCAMPAGLGFHPYFLKTEQTRLKAHVEGVWLSSDDCLPTEWHGGIYRGKDWTNGDVVDAEQLLDHCHTEFNGRFDIFEGEEATLTVKASPDCHWLHIYVPPGEDFFCAEPVNHMPDPFNKPNSGLKCLKTGESAMMWMDMTLHG